jgi:selenocysteine-specific elongation factor
MSTLNINLGVLGHVDSGKTTLVKALSSIASTACFDKNPQSKERGITLDLGFSSFSVDLPDHVKCDISSLYTKLQFTLGNLTLVNLCIIQYLFYNGYS